ncbi:MAG: hypothetical protein J0H42_16275 [Rhizobiales bacterium]|nr:hypothetical protein [Hyphomicrobiales bacterium]
MGLLAFRRISACLSDRADRMLRSFIAGMGADVGWLNLARTIRFEETHILTREEIARSAIDRRERAETPWKEAIVNSIDFMLG